MRNHDSVPSDDLVAVRCDFLKDFVHEVIDLFLKYDDQSDQDYDDQYYSISEGKICL